MTAWLAEDIMNPDVLTVNANMRVRDLAGFLSEHEISGAPVTDDAGRPVGVVSIMDIVSVDVAGSRDSSGEPATTDGRSSIASTSKASGPRARSWRISTWRTS